MARLAIIETDVPLPDMAAQYGSYGDIFAMLLKQGGLPESTIITKHFVVENPSALPSLEEDKPDTILITGSRYSAFDDVDWINKLSDYTAKAVDQGVKALGRSSRLVDTV